MTIKLSLTETLRRHPPAHASNRCCNKRFKVPGTDIFIEPGVKVVIPIHGIHSDPQYYPDPEKFDPERFSPENRAQRDQMTFIPFGDGPRNCVGKKLSYYYSFYYYYYLVFIIVKFSILINLDDSCCYFVVVIVKNNKLNLLLHFIPLFDMYVTPVSTYFSLFTKGFRYLYVFKVFSLNQIAVNETQSFNFQ